MSGKPVKPAAPADRSDHDAGPAPVGHERAAFARPAFKGVMRDRLQDRYDLLVIAGCAYAVNRLPVCMRGLKLVHDRSQLGFLRRVTERLGLKLVRLSFFLLNCSNNALHRYLLRLNLDQVVQQLGDQSLCGDLVKFGLVKESLHVRSDVGCIPGCRNYDAKKRCEGGESLYQDRLLLVRAEGDEGAGECCERSSVPQGYQPETALQSFRAPSANVAARKPASPRVLLSPLRAGGRRVKTVSDWLDSHWLGDLLGAICVFGFGFAVLLICWGIQP